MSERIAHSVEPKSIHIITYQDVLAHPALWPQYREALATDIKSGQSTWMLEALPEHIGAEYPTIKLCYYLDGYIRGYVEGNDKDCYQVYGPPIDPDVDERFHHVNTEPVDDIGVAKRTLFDYLKEKSKE